MREYIVETKNLKKYYQMGANTVKALDGVDFRVKDQEFVAIIGKSGSGKSTLLHMLGGLDVPTEGEVLVEGKCLLGLKKEQLAIFRRRKIGFIFQNYNLVPDLNVYENVILPVELDGRKVDVEYVDGILELLGLAEKREALPGTLSGGQQQRAAIARALAAKPAIILADEPTGNLDSVTSHDVLGLLKMAARQFSQTLILITHDRDIAQLADRIVQIEDGKSVGDTRKVSESYAEESESESDQKDGRECSKSKQEKDHYFVPCGSSFFLFGIHNIHSWRFLFQASENSKYPYVRS